MSCKYYNANLGSRKKEKKRKEKKYDNIQKETPHI